VPFAFLTISVFKARPWQHNRGLTETGGELTFARAVAVTSARRTDTLRPACAQRGFQFLFDDGFDHSPDPAPNLRLDGVWPPLEPFFPNSLPAIPFHRRHLPLLACQRVRAFERTR
jgi:hypothetical protein